MSSVERLRRNVPALTWIWIHLRHETSGAELAQALEQNPFVTEIRLRMEGAWTADWGTLLRVIAAREILTHVTLSGERRGQERNSPAARALVRAFLQATQQNNSIRAVDLEFLRLPADVSTFVDTASAIQVLSFRKCDFAPTERERGTRDLASALQHKNIKQLTLCVDDSCAIPILQALQSNAFLRNLETYGTFSDAASHAMQQLSESTTCITQFYLNYAVFRGESLRPIAQGLIQSQIVRELNFSYCFFYESIAIFRSILQEKRNLTSLSLDNCAFDGREVHDIIISTLSRPDSALRTLEVEVGNLLTLFPGGQLLNLFQAVEKSKLVCFKIGEIHSHAELQALTQSIPSMYIRELTIVFGIPLRGEETAAREFLQAVKHNFSLRSVKGEQIGRRDLFNDNDKKRLVFYANRNERLDQWVENPETVDQKVWPDALQLAQKAGPDFLFRGMRPVLESDYVKIPGARKRMRL